MPKQQLCTCITLFCTFLCRHCMSVRCNFLIKYFTKTTNLWQTRVEIRAMKYETAQIHFLGDFLPLLPLSLVKLLTLFYCVLRAPDSPLPLTNNRPHPRIYVFYYYQKAVWGSWVEANSLTSPFPILTETDQITIFTTLLKTTVGGQARVRNKSLVMKQSSPLKCVMALQPVVVHQCVSFVVWSSSLYFLCFCEWEYIIMINEKHKITKESYIWTKDEVERNRNKQLTGGTDCMSALLHFCHNVIS